MGEACKAAPGVYVIMRLGEKALFLHRLGTDYQPGKYMLPGGSVESDESIKQACVREVKEEVGIDIDPDDLVPAFFMYRPPHDETGPRADYFFVTDKWQSEPTIGEPHKCDELAQYSLDDLPETVPEYVRVAITGWLRGEVFSDFGWENLI